MKLLISLKITELRCILTACEGYKNRMLSTTVFRGLYDMREFEQNLARLEDAYSRDLIIQSREGNSQTH